MMRLKSRRYQEIEEEVLHLYEKVQIKSFPVDCAEICRQLSIRIMPYSRYSFQKRESLKQISKDGFYIELEMAKGRFQKVIFLNDRMPHQRIRFTLMHEIGHILLDHTEHSDLAESEANYFARYALAAPPLIHHAEIEDYLELASVFDISQQCALYAMEKYHKWLNRYHRGLLEHEKKIILLFKDVA